MRYLGNNRMVADAAGTVLQTNHHDPTAGDMTERYTYGYDAWGRPLAVAVSHPQLLMGLNK